MGLSAERVDVLRARVLLAASHSKASGKWRTIDELVELEPRTSMRVLLGALESAQTEGLLTDGNPRWAWLTKAGERLLTDQTLALAKG